MNASTRPSTRCSPPLDVNAKIHEGKAGEMLWDPLHRAGHRGAQEAARVRPLLRETARRAGEVVLRSVRARRVTIRLAFTRDVNDVPWESLPTEVIKREQQCWNFRPARAGTATRATATATRWSTRTS
jgi:hypothetical protein